MKIKILYDNKTEKDGILAGWGFSCLIGDSVLFDTGENGKSLLSNMDKMKVGISDIKDIVISHDHWDHIGGLETVLKNKKDIKVYGCKGFNREFQDLVNGRDIKLIELKHFSNITSNIFTTGTIVGTYKDREIEEQSLGIKTTKGTTIVTGCAHPGILKIVEHVKNLFLQEKIYCVLGGFHLKDMPDNEITSVCNELKDLGVQRAGPAHCSGSDGARIFKDIFGKDFIQISSGTQLEV